MSKAFKGITAPATRRALKRARAEGTRRRRSDSERAARMRELDDSTPLKPSTSDLIVGPAAERELARIRAERRAA